MCRSLVHLHRLMLMTLGWKLVEKLCRKDGEGVKKQNTPFQVWLTRCWALNVWGRSPGCFAADICLFSVFTGTCRPAGHTLEPVAVWGGRGEEERRSANKSKEDFLICICHLKMNIIRPKGAIKGWTAKNILWKQQKNSFLAKNGKFLCLSEQTPVTKINLKTFKRACVGGSCGKGFGGSSKREESPLHVFASRHQAFKEL